MTKPHYRVKPGNCEDPREFRQSSRRTSEGNQKMFSAEGAILCFTGAEPAADDQSMKSRTRSHQIMWSRKTLHSGVCSSFCKRSTSSFDALAGFRRNIWHYDIIFDRNREKLFTLCFFKYVWTWWENTEDPGRLPGGLLSTNKIDLWNMNQNPTNAGFILSQSTHHI